MLEMRTQVCVCGPSPERLGWLADLYSLRLPRLHRKGERMSDLPALAIVLIVAVTVLVAEWPNLSH